MNLPQGVRGRLVALALLLIPLVLLVRFVLWPLAGSYAASGSELDATREQIARYQRLLAAKPALEGALARLERNQPLAPYLLTGTNRALAAADLQRRLQEAAERLGVTMLSSRVRTPVVDGGLERIAIEARLRADTRELRDLLHEIETAKPYLFVEDLDINVRRVRRAGSSPFELDIALILYGLRAADPTGPDGRSRG